MKTITAKDAKNRFGELLEAVQHAPVRITRNGRQVAVVLSGNEYDAFAQMEDTIWSERANKAAEQVKFIGPKRSAELMKQYLKHA